MSDHKHGQIHIDDESTESVMAYCRTLLSCDPDDASYGDMLSKAGEMVARLRDGEDPHAFSAMCLYADILSDYYGTPAFGEYEAICEWVRRLHKQEQDLVAILEMLFSAYYELDMYEEADKVGRELCALLAQDDQQEEQYALCLCHLARNAFMNEQYHTAKEHLEQLYRKGNLLSENDGVSLSAVCYNLSLCYLRLGDFDRAAVLAEEARALYEHTQSQELANTHRLLERIKEWQSRAAEGVPTDHIGGFLLLKWLDIWADTI